MNDLLYRIVNSKTSPSNKITKVLGDIRFTFSTPKKLLKITISGLQNLRQNPYFLYMK